MLDFRPLGVPLVMLVLACSDGSADTPDARAGDDGGVSDGGDPGAEGGGDPPGDGGIASALHVMAYSTRSGSLTGPPQNVHWLGFQDGDGPWTEVVGVDGEYDLVVTDPEGRYGLAWACGYEDDTAVVAVQYARASEGAAVRIRGCLWDEVLGPRVTSRIGGRVLGGGSACLAVAIGDEALAAGCGLDTWELGAVPNWRTDVLATLAQDGVATRAMLRRDLDVAGDLDLDLDFLGPDAFDLTRRRRDPGGGAFATVRFSSANGVSLNLTLAPAGDYGGVPAAQQAAGEGHEGLLVAPDGSWAELVYFHDPIDLVASAPPAAPGGSALSLGADPYPRFAVDLDPLPPEVQGVGLDLSGYDLEGARRVDRLWSVRATAAWLDGATHLETPDLSAAPGWQAVYAPAANSTLGVAAFTPSAGQVVECFNAAAQPGFAVDGLRCPLARSPVSL